MGLTVLSLFDGIACARVALEKAGHKVDRYFASEIDKHAIKVAMQNYPDIVQIGDVTKVRYDNGILYTENGDFEIEIDFLCGGSPCQSFSIAGDGTGFNGKSGLINEYVRILNETKKWNPNIVFLLENVKMKKEWRDKISDMVGVQPIEINSALVSAQNRRRNYWTNIKEIEQPRDRGIYLKDILETNVSDEFILKNGWADWWNQNKNYQLKKQYSSLNAEKAICLTARQYASWNGNFVYLTKEEERVRYLKGSKKLKRNKNGFEYTFQEGKIEFPNNLNKKAQTLNTNQSLSRCTNFVAVPFALTETRIEEAKKIRKLTPIECERLQGLPDNFTAVVSNSQRYKCLGNGWQVDTIVHILSYMQK
jgi:DNA (cytosine-5)-methyltransferase 3A